jgi:cytochrome d ubiquinol oxidase subunit I
MIAFGTILSSFWILCNNSWMQVPIGYEVINGRIVPVDWQAIVLGPVFLIRWLHMLLATFLTTAMCIAAAGAWYILRNRHLPEARIMLRWGLGLTAVLIVLQIIVGDISGKYIYQYQPAKFAAIEARWQPEQPASEVWFAIPDKKNRRNLFTVETPYVGSWIATGNWTAPVSGLSDFPRKDWPPVLISFFSFRIMVGLGMLMLAVSWLGLWLSWRGRMETPRWFLWCTVLAFPSGFLAVIIGWITTEVGRQPWVVYGILRTADAVTPTLTGENVLTTLLGYLAVYTLIFLFGSWYLSGILRRGLAEAGGEIAGVPDASATGVAEAKE